LGSTLTSRIFVENLLFAGQVHLQGAPAGGCGCKERVAIRTYKQFCCFFSIPVRNYKKNYSPFRQAAVPSKSRLGRQKGLAAV